MKKLERYLSILHQVADETEINAEQIVSACKREDVADARALLINLLYEEGILPYPDKRIVGHMSTLCQHLYISVQGQSGFQEDAGNILRECEGGNCEFLKRILLNYQ